MFREMRRKNQALSEKVCEEVLRAEPRGVLAVYGENGYPYAIPVNYYYQDGHIYIHGGKQGHKIDALKQNGKACFTVTEQGVKLEDHWWYTVRSIVIFGTCHLVTDPQEVYPPLLGIALKYFPDRQKAYDDAQKSKAGTMILDITIDHMTGKIVNEE